MSKAPVVQSLACRTGEKKAAGLTSDSANILSDCNRIYSSLTVVYFFDDDYEGKQPVAQKEHCAVMVKITPGKYGYRHVPK